MDNPIEALFCRGERGQGVEEFEIWYLHEDGAFRECNDSPECITGHSYNDEDTPTLIRLTDYIDLMMDYDTLLWQYAKLKGNPN